MKQNIISEHVNSTYSIEIKSYIFNSIEIKSNTLNNLLVNLI
jgi:hypothetical protein